MGLNELIAQLRAAGATVVPGTGVNQLFMDVAGHILTVNGEQIQVFDLTPSYQAGDSSAITRPGSCFFGDWLPWFHAGLLLHRLGRQPPRFMTL